MLLTQLRYNIATRGRGKKTRRPTKGRGESTEYSCRGSGNENECSTGGIIAQAAEIVQIHSISIPLIVKKVRYSASSNDTYS